MGLKLLAEVGLDGSGFESGLKRLEGGAHGLVGGLKGLVMGGIGVYTVEQALSKTIETAKELVDTSERLSIAPEQLQVLRQAAKNAGTDMEKLAGAFEKIDIARQKALSGDKGALKAFAAAGIDQGALHSQTAAQLFMGPLGQMAKGRNSEEIGIIFRELGIKAFGGLIPVLKTNFEELGDQMQKMGAIIDTETAVKLKLLSDEFTLLAQIIASKLGPAIIALAEILYKSIGGLATGYAYIKTYLGSFFSDKKSDAMADIMGGTPGFGGWSPGQKEQAQRGKDEAILNKHWEEGDLKKSAEAAKAAALAEIQKWSGPLDKLKKRMEELAEELKNPKPPNFDNATIPGKGNSKKLLEAPGDSLTRVGNFLGGSQNALLRAAQDQVGLLREIATNTRVQDGPYRGTVDKDNDTNFPM